MEWSNKCKGTYLQASSIAESVIATAIIAICMLLAVKVYTAVLNDTVSAIDVVSKFEVDRLVNRAKENQNFGSEEFEYPHFKIKKNAKQLDANISLMQINYAVMMKRDTVIYKFLVIKNDTRE